MVSAIVIIKNICLCADLRSLNKNIIVDCHPLPKIQEVLAATCGSRNVSLIDLKSAYHRVILSEDSKEYTTFITPFGAFRLIKLPSGLASASSVFQKLMDVMFKDINGVEKFQDDILIYASTVEEHNEILDAGLCTLMKRGMTVSLNKCTFLKTDIEYLGHVLSPVGIKQKMNLVKIISEAPKPDDKDSLKSFMGLSEY